MIIECVATIKRSPEIGKIVYSEVKVTLEGDFEDILELLRKTKFDLDLARDIELK